MKNHTTQEARSNNWKHALRKRRIAREVLGCNYYSNLHQYSKNKIHCSCPLCKDCQGHLRASDRKKIEDINFQIKEFENE